MVAAFAASLGVPHATLNPTEPIAGSLQAAARAARYALLEDWRQERRLDWVLTAHHADDQLETLVMRLGRTRFAAGRRQPIEQALFMADVFANGTTTTFFRGTTTGAPIARSVHLTRDGSGRITSLRDGTTTTSRGLPRQVMVAMTGGAGRS